jgi:hypothetical protein
MTTDVRLVGRVVAGVLLAPGTFSADERARADAALSALGRPPLGDDDLVADPPERLAPAIPTTLREPLLDALYLLAGDEPIRRRVADSYAGLWHARADEPAARRRGPRVLRWLIGDLPRHHAGAAPEETTVTHDP